MGAPHTVPSRLMATRKWNKPQDHPNDESVAFVRSANFCGVNASYCPTSENRFYVGEVVYRGEVHRGEHEPLLDSALFEAVQAKLAAQVVARRCRLRGSPALLSGRLFDNRGNRMSPTHSNKGGVRYRYYVSQAVLQGKPPPPGLVGRVPAAEIEALVVAALRKHLNGGVGEPLPDNDGEFLKRHLERVTLTPNHLELRLRQSVEIAQAHNPANNDSSGPPIAINKMLLLVRKRRSPRKSDAFVRLTGGRVPENSTR